MTLKTYLAGISISTLFCWFAWALTLINIDPSNGGSVGFLSFYISLFFAIVGTFTLIGFNIRLWFTKNELYFENINISFRQAILVGCSVIGLLMIQSFRLLNIFNGILFVLAIILLESYFLARR